ncbi:hypothetical protein AiwAL_01470 [Acidiphilium sp. AL]|nr:hypothetical protein [Acidiphilium sp. AL]
MLAGVLGACGIVPSSVAQIVVNQQALRQLSGHKPAPSTVHRPAPRIARRVIRHHAVVRPLPLPPPPPPQIATAHQPPPPKPKPPRAVTLVFSSTAAELQAAQSRDLAGFIGAMPDPAAHFVIQATAPGIASDPSVARRLSLNRGLAVRAVLRRAGIKSDHIIVQALGDPPGMPDNRAVLTEIP